MHAHLNRQWLLSWQYGGGFAEEVRQKYDTDVFLLFTAMFELLPLACTSSSVL